MYKSKIRFYKILSIILASLVVFFVVYSIVSAPKDKVSGESQGSTKSSVSITKSVLNGADENGNVYVIKSKSVEKRDVNLYDLVDISGFYSLGKAGLDMIANFGILNDNEKMLHLKRDITLEYLGYKLISNHMDLNLSDMSVSGDDHVSVIRGGSEISASSFSIDNTKKIIHFQGNVRTHVKISDFK